MPRTIEIGFEELLQKLKPSSFESLAATSHRASIEGCLRNNFGLIRFVRIGSFGNGTSVSGFSDVDYLACLPTASLTQTSTASLTKVRNALDYRFPTSGVYVDCPAIVAPFGTIRSETTEIVIADKVDEQNGYKIYDIPDCSGGWMHAAPDAHNDYVERINRKLSYRVKPLIQLIKAWKYYRSVPISSFYLELRIAKYAETETSIIYDIDVKRVLRMLWDAQLAGMQDPVGISGLIPACKSAALRLDALSKLSTAVTRAEKARDASQKGDVQDAFAWWRLLYNDQFPTYYY